MNDMEKSAAFSDNFKMQKPCKCILKNYLIKYQIVILIAHRD